MGDRPISAESGNQNIKSKFRHVAQSAWPAQTLGALMLATAPLSPGKFPGVPHFVQRMGFGAIMLGAGYVIGHDQQNGVGIATAWTMTYLALNLKKSLVAPRSAIALLLSSSTITCAVLYGTEYFHFMQDDTIQEAKRRKAPQVFDV